MRKTQLVLLVTAWSFFSTGLLAQDIRPLWEPMPAKSLSGINLSPQTEEAVLVKVDLELLYKNAPVSLDLLGGQRLLVSPLSRFREHTRRSMVWIGTDSLRRSQVKFSVHNSAVAGTVRTHQGTLFRLRQVAGPVHVLERLDRRRFPREAKPLRLRYFDAPQKRHLPSVDKNRTKSHIDIMVLYTPKALKDEGTHDGMIAKIDQAIDDAQESFDNSRIPIELSLVYADAISYSETSELQFDLDAMHDPADQKLDALTKLRRKFAADIVVLITRSQDQHGACGLAYQMQYVRTSHCREAYAVVPHNCMTEMRSFVHEIGHIMGADHDIDQSSPPFPFSRGFSKPHPVSPSVPPWKTVMAYGSHECPDGTGCERQLYWSSPEIMFEGEATGEFNEADNRSALEQTRSTVEKFYPSDECN